ncbi:MAG: hypothetical protein AB7O79_07355 [Xanthobacteraceae bacterium]
MSASLRRGARFLRFLAADLLAGALRFAALRLLLALLAFFAFVFLLAVDFFDFFDFVVFFFFVRLAMRRSLSQKSDDNAETCFRVPALRTKPEFSNCAPPK